MAHQLERGLKFDNDYSVKYAQLESTHKRVLLKFIVYELTFYPE